MLNVFRAPVLTLSPRPVPFFALNAEKQEGFRGWSHVNDLVTYVDHTQMIGMHASKIFRHTHLHCVYVFSINESVVKELQMYVI